MKKKIHKILGVALTLVLLASLCAFAAPVSADPDELEWSKYPFPVEGWLGGFFNDSNIDLVGPIDQAINGDLYAYAQDATSAPTVAVTDDIFKSTDGGRFWTVSEHPVFSYAGGPVVDIVCSSEDADIVYVADATTVYCSMDGSETFAPLAPATLTTLLDGTDTINSMDVGYIGGDPFVFVSTTGVVNSVFYVEHVPGFILGWADLDLQTPYGGYDVYSVNCPPNFETTSTIYAIITLTTDTSERTLIVTNSGEVGTWIPFAPTADIETNTASGVGVEIDGASNICFPGDFADNEVFVGICGVEDDTGAAFTGSVYRVSDGLAPCTFRLADPITFVPGADVWSLELTGNIGSTQLLAGAQDSTAIWYSNTDGMSWAAARKPPTGAGPTYVLMAEDFAASGEAWAATQGDEGAISFTIDGGDLWNQISLISTDIGTIWDVSFYPDYQTSGRMFMAAMDTASNSDSLWRFDGTYWERVVEEMLLEALFPIADVDIYQVEVSPDILTTDVVYIASDYNVFDGPTPTSNIFRSGDVGQSWLPLGCQIPVAGPSELWSWTVIDEDTLLVGGDDGAGNGVVYKNTSGGNRCWTETLVGEITGIIVDFDVDGDSVLCASYDTALSAVAISEDIGDTWDMVATALPEDADTCVAFDTDFGENDTFYVGNTDEVTPFTSSINRCAIDRGLPWFAQVWTNITDGATIVATSAAEGISDIVASNGCLYVSDYTTGAGMWRSVNPTGPMLPAVLAPVFEQVGAGFDMVADPMPGFGTAEIRWLDATGGNVIWALDQVNTFVLWTFEDCLCCGLDLTSPTDGSNTGRTDSAYLDWEDGCFATCYDIQVYTSADFLACCPIYTTPCVGPDSCHFLTPIPDGTTFYWRVRVAAGSPLLSKWSTIWSFSTIMGAAQWNPFSGPVTEYPYPGSSNVAINPTFAWNKADWATGYEFVLSANADYSDPLAEVTVSTPVYAYEGTLAYSTTYYWKVRAVSDTTDSNWAEGVFTTGAKPVEVVPPPPPVEIPPTPAPISPAWIWAIVIIGAVLVIAVIVLIVTTRRVP